jgi:DNA-binding MarR family transcriptional regulator
MSGIFTLGHAYLKDGYTPDRIIKEMSVELAGESVVELQTFVKSQLELVEELRKVDTELGIQTLACFLLIARNEGMGVMELAEKLDISGASASRNVGYLSKERGRGHKGYNLIDARYDEYERRRKVLTLTKEGHSLLKRLNTICTKAASRSACG